MAASVRKIMGNTIVIQVAGKLHLGEAVDEFRARWSDALATGVRNVIVNLAEVPTVDSSGIGSIVRCHSAVTGNGGKVKIVGAGDGVMHAFRLTHLDTVLDLHPDEESALAALTPRSL